MYKEIECQTAYDQIHFITKRERSLNKLIKFTTHKYTYKWRRMELPPASGQIHFTTSFTNTDRRMEPQQAYDLICYTYTNTKTQSMWERMGPEPTYDQIYFTHKHTERWRRMRL